MNCHNCGHTIFTRKRRATGVWIETVVSHDGEMVVEESTTDGLECATEPVCMTCEGCQCKVPNPDHPHWMAIHHRVYNELRTLELIGKIKPFQKQALEFWKSRPNFQHVVEP